jgi:hypothetical protein
LTDGARSGLAGRLVAAAALALLTIAAWRPCFEFFFFSDDFALVADASKHGLADTIVRHSVGFHRVADDPYFRPAWHVLFQLAHAAFGLEPRGYFVASVLLHLAVVLALFGLVVRATGETWIAASAAAVFAVAPGPTEAVVWPSAAFNVPPCGLLLLGAGWSLWRWLDERRRGALVAFLALWLASFTCKEAGYQMVPLYAATAWWATRAFGSRCRELAVVGAALVVTVLLHYGFLNILPVGESFEQRVESARTATADTLRGFLGLSATLRPNSVLVGGGVVLAALLWFGSRRTRFALLWAVAGLFPYVAKTSASRFAYFFAMPACLALALLGADAARRFGRVARVAAVAALLAFAGWNVAQLRLDGPWGRSTVETYRGQGETCRTALASLRRLDFGTAPAIALERMPAALGATPQMLETWCGVAKPVIDLELFKVAPFALYFAKEFDELAGDVAYLTWKDGEGWRRVQKSDLFADLIALPMFSMRFDYAVVKGPGAAVESIRSRAVDPKRTVVLYQEPDPPFVRRPDAKSDLLLIGTWENNEFEYETTAQDECFFVIHFFGDLTSKARARSQVLVDRQPVPILRADGKFNAVRVPAGHHTVRVIVHGDLAAQ